MATDDSSPKPTPDAGTTDAAPDANALGFDAPKRQERYNTQFLVANFEKDERRTKLILGAVALACGAGIAAALLFSGGGGEKKPEHAPEADVPAATAPAAKPAVPPVPAAPAKP